MKPSLILFLLLPFSGLAQEKEALTNFLQSFQFSTAKDMKMSVADLLPLLQSGKAQLIDIRFPSEHQIWQTSLATHIPLNELPERLNELDKTKIIVTACPHRDRSAVAMVYLRAQGIPAKYLVEGLPGLVEALKGGASKAFLDGKP
jgi:rhodanese-related sulfurtransferase